MIHNAREWTIKSVRKGNEWENKYGSFQSYGLALDGIGEPVQLNKKIPVKYEPQVGDTLYGSLEEMAGKDGRLYYKFKSESNPNQATPPSHDTPGVSQTALPIKKEWQPRDDNAIRAQWAIGQARDLYGVAESDLKPLTQEAQNVIEANAKTFYTMVERVRGEDSPKANAPSAGLTPEEETAQRFAKQDAERINATLQDKVITDFDQSEPINLDDIPF